MLRNYLVTIVRQIRRKPGFYALNVFGLSVGLVAFVLMFKFTSYELSFDRFCDRPDDVYRVNFSYNLNKSAPYHVLTPVLKVVRLNPVKVLSHE